MSITHIAETMLRREYNKRGITLPVKFWNLVEYKNKYQFQMRLAAKLIRTYGEPAVQAVIDRETWCYSLAAKSLPDLMEAESHSLRQKEMVEKITTKPKEQEDLADVPQWRNTAQPKSKLLDE